VILPRCTKSCPVSPAREAGCALLSCASPPIVLPVSAGGVGEPQGTAQVAAPPGLIFAFHGLKSIRSRPLSGASRPGLAYFAAADSTSVADLVHAVGAMGLSCWRVIQIGSFGADAHQGALLHCLTVIFNFKSHFCGRRTEYAINKAMPAPPIPMISQQWCSDQLLWGGGGIGMGKVIKWEKQAKLEGMVGWDEGWRKEA